MDQLLQGSRMRQTVSLKDQRNLNHSHRLIDLAMTQEGMHEMIIRPQEEKRRPLQNRLYHHWNGEIADQHDGMSQEYFEAINKMRFGIPVRYRRDDPVYRGIIDTIKKQYTYEEQLEIFMTSAVEVTRNLYVKEMTEVLSNIERYWAQQGIRLTTGDDLYNKAIGRKK